MPREFKPDNGRSLWDKVWSGQTPTACEYRKNIEKEAESVRWRKIEKEILRRRRSFEDLKVVELGSGRGVIALLMGLKGAEVMLVDYSDVALNQAELLYKEFNCRVKLLKADVLSLPRGILGQFDISLSFGLCEHFTGNDRQRIFDAHFSVLRDEGITFISVPNKLCLPYRIWKKRLELTRAWPYGKEEAFSRLELFNRAAVGGFSSCRILGSSLLGDCDHFLFYGILSRLGVNLEVPLPWDDYFGYALILAGCKTKISGDTG